MHRWGIRGWVASATAAILLSLIFLVVDKHIRTPLSPTASQDAHAPLPPTEQATEMLGNKVLAKRTGSHDKGVVLVVDPGLAQSVESFPLADDVSLARTPSKPREAATADLISQPPEPVADVTLLEPIAESALTALPLHSDQKRVGYLMDAMDKAFERPTKVVSSHRPVAEVPNIGLDPTKLAQLPAPVVLKPKIPIPVELNDSLAELQIAVDERLGSVPHSDSAGHYIGTPSNTPHSSLSPQVRRSLSRWIIESQNILHRVVYEYGLEHPKSLGEIERLSSLAKEATGLADDLTDFETAATILRLGYSVQRRSDLWLALRRCLDETSIALSSPRSPELSKQNLLDTLTEVNNRLNRSPDGESWRQFLLLDDLEKWLASSEKFQPDAEMIERALSRLSWPELDPQQMAMLSAREFQNLAANLQVAQLESVDYRELLTLLEELETDPASRIRSDLAAITHWLSISSRPEQRDLAATINTHYRNANLRLSVAGELLERFLPDGHYEVRPVRRRILGADTRGNSAIETQLKLQLLPDPSAWHVGINVAGNMLSNTQSVKGPAVFHNTSTAQIDSSRYIRISPEGYSISREPTNVNSQDYLRKMSTDYDGLPIVGDFIRVLVREQFDQKRGLAKRVSQRIIAQETDQELDRQLGDQLDRASREFEQRLIGPLQRLSLNPTVSSISSTESRLTVRYRVASELQMAAHTPRPRAPRDNLLSLQFHQSSINNAIAQLGLSGKTWNIGELYSHLGNIFQQTDWMLPDDVPQDISIRFAQTRPATVEMIDGKLRLTLRIAELNQPSRNLSIKRFLVHSTYVPIANGLEAELVRDGVVEIVTEGTRNRVVLRLIFAKVFVSNPQIPLISEQWQTDERAEGLAVSQLAIRDGWLALAIGNSDSPQAAEVAARAREIKAR